VIDRLRARAVEPVDGASLFLFRIALGALLLIGVARLFAYGWIGQLYVEPEFFFSYWGLSWVKPWPGIGMYLHVGLLGLAAVALMVGFHHRIAAGACWLLFTYVELLDKSAYLNHYYLVSLVLALMVFMPLGRGWSLDARRTDRPTGTVPRWCLWTLRLQFGLVYFYAGVAKLGSDWLFSAQPLKIWLTANADAPLVGPLLVLPGVAYAASWFGAIFDLTLPLWLSWRRSRPYAYLVALGFHVFTAYLFQLGMFPFIMMAGATLFFEPDWPRRLWAWVRKEAPRPSVRRREEPASRRHGSLPSWALGLLAVHFAVQVIVPLRHFAYPGDTRWTEEGFRFAWRVMLVEKAGRVVFHVVEPSSSREWLVYPRKYLSRLQRKAFATQPDMILQLAHHVAEDFRSRGHDEVEVRAEAYVAMNGRRSAMLIDPDVDLAHERDGLWPKPWICPLTEEGGGAGARSACSADSEAPPPSAQAAR